MGEPVDLATVLGRNARRLRGHRNLDDVAKAARAVGLSWGTGRVSDLEHCKVSPTLQTLVGLAWVFSALGESVTLADLVGSDENIVITKDSSISGAGLQDMLRGADALLYHPGHGMDREISGLQRFAAWSRFGEPEQRLQRDLGVDGMRLAAEMVRLWQRTYSEERDRRAGSGASAQKKGRISRQLKAELKAVFDGDDQ